MFQSSPVQYKYSMNHKYFFKLSGNYIKKVKRNKRGEINFNNVFNSIYQKYFNI